MAQSSFYEALKRLAWHEGVLGNDLLNRLDDELRRIWTIETRDLNEVRRLVAERLSALIESEISQPDFQLIARVNFNVATEFPQLHGKLLEERRQWLSDLAVLAGTAKDHGYSTKRMRDHIKDSILPALADALEAQKLAMSTDEHPAPATSEPPVTEVDTPPHVPPIDKSLPSAGHQTVTKKPRRRGLLIGVLTAAFLAGAGAVVFLYLNNSEDAPSTDKGSPAPSAPFARQAQIRYTQNLGVHSYQGPANTYPRGGVSYLEGQVIAVSCQKRGGQAIHDPKGDPKRYKKPWPVWDKLTNGLWIPDLYTDLPKVPGSKPPDGVPLC